MSVQPNFNISWDYPFNKKNNGILLSKVLAKRKADWEIFFNKKFWINPRISDVALVASNLPPWYIFHKHSQMLWQERLVSLLSGAKENFIFSSVIQTVENKMMWQERPLSMLANRIILSFVSNTAKNIFKNKRIFFWLYINTGKGYRYPKNLKK